jgi:hypothetical protein
MGLITTKRGYLLWAIVAFLLAAFGFAGMLEGRGGGLMNPLYAELLCFALGCMFLYFYFSEK